MTDKPVAISRDSGSASQQEPVKHQEQKEPEPNEPDDTDSQLYYTAHGGDDDIHTRSYTRPNNCPRFVPRNLPFFQSENRLRVHHNKRFQISVLLQHDWFHVLLRIPTWKSVPYLLGVWTVMIIIFAGLYMRVDRRNPELNCGLGLENDPIAFGPAFAFSLETCTTVGYGLPNGTNAFFENCRALQVVIYFQMTWSMMFNAFLFAFFYSRLAKCDARGAQVVFSNKAIVTKVDDQLRFQIRVYDVDAESPVVEAHVRLYAVTKRRPVPRPLRVLQPDDDNGAMLFLSLPSVVSHHIDVYSLLHPPKALPVNPSGLILRQADSAACNREDVVCPVCAESYGTYARLRRHIKYQQMVEEHDEYPVEGSHLALRKTGANIRNVYKPTMDMAAVKSYFENEISEIIVVVEAIEPIGSGTFQAMQSYMAQDIVFHEESCFRPCIEAKPQKGGYTRVDLDRFHGIDFGKGHARPSFDELSAADDRSVRAHDSWFQSKFSFRKRKRNKKTPSELENGSSELEVSYH